MSIMHVFVIADAHGWNTTTQFRSHEAIPWDEAYELYLDPPHLAALIALARAAQAGGDDKLRGRVFDAIRAIKAAEVPHEYHRRDSGPYAVVTPSSVYHRMELEQYVAQWDDMQWNEARAFAVRLDRLSTIQD